MFLFLFITEAETKKVYIAEEPIRHDALDQYIDTLANEYECRDCPELFKRLDSNNRYSYGCLQFQEATFISSVKRYKLLPQAEDHEIMNFIYDCEFQKTVAREMFLSEKDAANHWFTSIYKGHPPARPPLGAPPRVF